MEIILNDGKSEVMLRGNDGSFDLCYPVMVKGEKTFVPQLFYTNPAQALDALFKLKLSNAEVKTLQELKEAIVNIRKEIIETFKVTIPAKELPKWK